MKRVLLWAGCAIACAGALLLVRQPIEAQQQAATPPAATSPAPPAAPDVFPCEPRGPC